ncbi:glycosyltransferase family 4 protein [Candidatus Kapabacteria bacterium]|nr:glycosyltransferase family 4 protein [Candidatus Kapabacteria bacterium]
MKILIINSSDIRGGAARAALRLHNSLLDESVDSHYIVQSKISTEHTVIGPKTKLGKAMGFVRPELDLLPGKIFNKPSKTYFSSNWIPFSGIIKIINDLNPDIVHIHWINGGMFRIEELKKIKSPIVWSLHDMWPFRGGYHYLNNLEFNSKKQFYPISDEGFLSNRIWKRKSKTYKKINSITVVGLSKWLMNESKNSLLFNNRNHINLPNPINTNIFKSIDKNICRKLWNLPTDKKLILFGAVGAISDPRKGFNELSKALSFLKRRKDLELVVFGASKPSKPDKFEFNTHYVGSLKDDLSLITLYNAVDTVIVPSLQENLSNVIMESISCGTPVVSFDIGGNPDLIDHKLNGYLAKPYDPEDLARGIEWVLNHPNPEELSKNAREKVLREFDSKVVAKKYIELYKSILAKN